MKRIRVAVTSIVILIFVLGALLPLYIGIRLPYWPTHPDAAHRVPFNNHGVIHYVSRIEGWYVSDFLWLYVPCFLIAFFVVARSQWDRHQAKAAGNPDDARF